MMSMTGGRPEPPEALPASSRDQVDGLIDGCYRELKALASRALARERKNHTLQATELVNEAYLRLSRGGQVDWTSRTHFLAGGALCIRRLLVDHERRRRADRRQADARVTLSFEHVSDEEPEVDLLAIDEALTSLATHSPRAATIVELRYFGGLSQQEVGALLDIDERTVRRDWRAARAWLRRALSDR